MSKNNQSHSYPEAKLPLVVDASSTPLHLGIPGAKGWEKLVSDEGQVMEGLFRALRKLFNGRSDKLNSVDAVYYCCGPGSTLGLRLAAAFVKTLIWESEGKTMLYQYNALDMAASFPNNSHKLIQAPFRMGKRFVRSGEPLCIGKKEIFPEEKAIGEYPDSLHLPGMRALSVELPADKTLKYDLEKVSGLEVLKQISEPIESPAPYSPEPATFKKWEPVIPTKQ
jgi:hypothetical protein